MKKLNTIAYRLDEDTLKKLNYIHDHYKKTVNIYLSFSEITRYAINYLYLAIIKEK